VESNPDAAGPAGHRLKGQGDLSVLGTLQPAPKTDNLAVKPLVGSATAPLLTNQ